VNQAIAVLAREVGRLPEALGAGSSAPLPVPHAGEGDLRQQAHQLLAGIFAAFGQPGPTSVTGVCPVTQASPPLGFDKDALRRQAHEFIDTLLVTFRQATSEDGVVAENKVPLIQCASPTQAGDVARVTLNVANEEPTPSEVTLYSSNFVADSGYEIPSLRVSASPRVVTLAPRAQASFEIRVSVPPQTPPGTYSGLVQALGSKYVKAVLSVRVL
jgi:hypothetical protein